MTTTPALTKGGAPINTATDVIPKPKKRQSVGGQIVSIVIFSILAGSRLEAALLHHLAPGQPYEWIEDLILGLGMLIGVIALALRLGRAMLKPTCEQVPSSGERHCAH